MRELRIHPRTPMKCTIKLTHESVGELLVQTRDISDGGVFILRQTLGLPPIGSIVTGQVQGMGADAPVLQMEVVREDPHGVGLRFVNSDSQN